MAILQLIAEEEKSLCFDFLEEKIREESRKLIESICADEVNQFLEKMASISNFNPQHLTISHCRQTRFLQNLVLNTLSLLPLHNRLLFCKK